MAAVPVAPQMAAGAQPYTARRFSYDAETLKPSLPAEPVNQQIQQLQQEIIQLRQEADALRPADAAFDADAWWSQQQRGNGGTDPSLFQ